MVIVIVSIVFILLQQKTNLNVIETYVKINFFVMLLCLLKAVKYYNLIIIKNLIKHHLLFIIYTDLECLVENNDECKNNPENPFKTKEDEHIPLSEDSMKKFCDPLRENVKLEIIAIIERNNEIGNLKYSVPKKYPEAFHNESNYD